MVRLGPGALLWGALAIALGVAAVRGSTGRAAGLASVVLVLVALAIASAGLMDVQPLVGAARVEPDEVRHGRELLFAAILVSAVGAAVLLAAGKKWAAVLVLAPSVVATSLSYLNPDDGLGWWGVILFGPVALGAAVVAAARG
jgi:hypothetical protein